MKTAVRETSIRAFHDHSRSGAAAGQREKILNLLEMNPRLDWSIGEIAYAMGMEKSTVSARINELLAVGELEERPRRKDRRSGVTVRPVALACAQGRLL